jgi:hypothetical protein
MFDLGSPQGEPVRVADGSSGPPRAPAVVRQPDPGSPPGGPAPLSSSPTENYPLQRPTHTTRERVGGSNATAKKSRHVTDDDPDFAAFWTAYPRKVDKGHARKAWASALKDETDPRVITAGAEAFAAQCARNRTQQRFIPHPATWLNGERWADQPLTASPPPTGHHQPYRNPADISAYLGDL